MTTAETYTNELGFLTVCSFHTDLEGRQNMKDRSTCMWEYTPMLVNRGMQYKKELHVFDVFDKMINIHKCQLGNYHPFYDSEPEADLNTTH